MKTPRAALGFLSGLALTVVTAAGCSTNATTNAQSLGSGIQSYTFRQAEIDSVKAKDGTLDDIREFVSLPRNLSETVHYNGQPLETTLENELIPGDNSTRFRFQEHTKVVPKDEKYQIANAFNRDGKRILNYGATPIASFFVLSEEPLPVTISSDELDLIATQVYKKHKQESPYVTFGENPDRFISKPIEENEFGGPRRVFIDTLGAIPLCIEDFDRTIATGVVNGTYLCGVVANGYYPIKGEGKILETSEDTPLNPAQQTVRSIENPLATIE